jgi:hypothetical protein
MPPPLTPIVVWPFWMLLPKAEPTHGVMNPSAQERPPLLTQESEI